jgi:hypothetical protein
MVNLRLFAVNGSGKRKFVFLGQQMINGNSAHLWWKQQKVHGGGISELNFTVWWGWRGVNHQQQQGSCHVVSIEREVNMFMHNPSSITLTVSGSLLELTNYQSGLQPVLKCIILPVSVFMNIVHTVAEILAFGRETGFSTQTLQRWYM